jgi:capsid protein
MIAREARQIDRTTTLGPLIVEAATSFVVADGFYPQIVLPEGRTDRARQIEDLFITWAENAEHTGQCGWGELQAELLKAAYLDGDVGAVLVAQGDDPMAGRSVQIVEAQQIRDGVAFNPRRDMPAEGVRLDASGRVLGYAVATFKGGKPSSTDISVIDARNFIFLSFRDQPSAYRGVSPLRGMMDRIIGCDELFLTYVQACNLSSKLAAFTSSRRPELTSKLIGANKNSATPGAPKTTGIAGGSIHHLGEDVTVNFPQSPYPAAAFDANLRMMLRVLGARMGVPLEIVLLDASQSTAYAGRSAIRLARRQFRRVTARLHRNICSRILHWRLREWAERGVIRVSEEELAHLLSPMGVRWIGAPDVVFDDDKEVAARVMAVSNNLTSKRRVSEEMYGEDWYAVAAEREAEMDEENDRGIRPALMPGQSAGGGGGASAPSGQDQNAE